MGFKIKNSLTGEFEKLPILTLKGEKGETGGVEEYNKVDYMGNKYETLKQANDANVEYAVKTAIGEFNYLDYDGQHITATDTIEGRSKSAILKGQTMVNLIKGGDVKKEITYSGGTKANYRINKDMLVANKTYLLLFTVTNFSGDIFLASFNKSDQYGITRLTDIGNGLFKAKVNFSDLTSVTDTLIIYKVTGATLGGYAEKVMLIPYQEEMENWDIPYFEGMQSVKMPVLTTTGKNLFDVKDFAKKCGGTVNGNEYDSTTSKTDAVYDIFIPKGYTISYTVTQIATNGTPSASALAFIREDGTIFHRALNSLKRYVITASENYVGIKIINYCTGWKFSEFQIEQGSQATPFEPHKSNILTVNEPIELRGIGDVKDTLDCLTGEVIQRIGEADLTKGWESINYQDDDFISLYKADKIITRKENVVCDKLPIETWGDLGTGKKECVWINGATSWGVILSKTKATNREEIIEWLSQNLKINHKLATPTIKTVDLSDNHVYSYKGTTHYDCSSAEGSLVPTLSVKVPTDVQATIAQQRETIQTLNSENERLNQIQEALKASMLDSQVQLMNLSWNTDFEVFTLRESIAPKDFLLASRTGSNIDKFSQAKFIIENDCPDLEKLNSQIEYYFSKDVFSQEQFEELTDLISIVKGGNGCEY